MAYRRTTAMQSRIDATRQRIVDSALRLVAERGYAGCSVALVASEAGIATGSVYRHFPTKSSLLTEAFRAATQRELEAVRTASEQPGSACQRTLAGVETFARRALRSPRLAFALLAEPVDTAIETERLAFRMAYRAIFAEVVMTGVADRELPPQDADVTAACIVGALAEALVSALHTEGLSNCALASLTAQIGVTITRTLGADLPSPT